MKIQTAILVFVCISAMAQDSLISGGNFLGTGRGSYADDIARQKNFQAEIEFHYVPKDPWRVIDGHTNYAKGPGWVGFCGKVVEVQPTGIRLDGHFGITPALYYEDDPRNSVFFVAGFPYQVAENDVLSGSYSAMENGVYTYSTVTGGTSTIRKLDYGIPCDTPEWFIQQQKEQAEAAQVAATAAFEAQKKKTFELQKHAVEWLQHQATNGSASAQCSLGLHYLNGQGVETNKETAVYWLTKASNQGDFEASNILTKLNSN